MLSQSSFDDQALVESFYGELFNRFYSTCESSVRSLLKGCSLGIAPSPTGIKTFFIVAPNLEVAEQLIQNIDSIIDQVANLMAGVEQTGICFVPPNPNIEATKDLRQPPSRFMVGKFFPNHSESDMND